MNTYDIGPESFYFLEILGHGFPIIAPIVLDQGSPTVVIIVDAPDDEWSSRSSLNEPFVVRTYFDPFELVRICSKNTGGGQVWGKTCPSECQEMSGNFFCLFPLVVWVETPGLYLSSLKL